VVFYREVETEGHGKGYVVMCAGLVQGGGDGGKWIGFSVNMCWFGRWETEGNGKSLVVMGAAVSVMICCSLRETK
jgi:hypothetical protein